MKSKVVFCICLVLALPLTGYCQIGKAIKGLGETVEAVAKKTAKKAGREIGEEAVEKTVKEVAGEVSERAIAKNASKKLVNNAPELTLKGTAKDISRVGAEKAIRSGLKIVDAHSIRLTDHQLTYAGSKTGSSALSRFGTAESCKVFEREAKEAMKDKGAKIAAKRSGIRASRTLIGEQAMKDLDELPRVKSSVEQMMKKSSYFQVENLSVEKLGKKRIVQFNGSISKIEIDEKGVIIAKGGSTKEVGQMNEFLNNPMPNTTYRIDNFCIYKTDARGRTIYSECHSSELSKGFVRNDLASENSTALVLQKGGKQGVHDSGHIQQHSTNGPNESINLLPMKSSLQRGGRWANLEKMERDAISEGKDVISKKTISYNDDGSFVINVELIIKDLITGKVKTITKPPFSDLF